MVKAYVMEHELVYVASDFRRSPKPKSSGLRAIFILSLLALESVGWERATLGSLIEIQKVCVVQKISLEWIPIVRRNLIKFYIWSKHVISVLLVLGRTHRMRVD